MVDCHHRLLLPRRGGTGPRRNRAFRNTLGHWSSPSASILRHSNGARGCRVTLSLPDTLLQVKIFRLDFPHSYHVLLLSILSELYRLLDIPSSLRIFQEQTLTVHLALFSHPHNPLASYNWVHPSISA